MKVLLFDADGVLTIPEEMFAQEYAKARGQDPDEFNAFFSGPFSDALIGKADLKKLIEQNKDLWQWDGDIDDLLKLWFESEDVCNEELLEFIAQIRSQGFKCYLATNQERYRGEYMKHVMFINKFDGFYISAELGFCKPNAEFFNRVIKSLEKKYPDLKPEDIIYFDDTQKHVDAARQLGLDAHLYQSPEQVKTVTIESR